MRTPRVMIMHAPGTNRDREAAMACRLAGGEPEIVHINQLISGARRLADFQMLVVPGGFSYGDDLGAGRLWANDLYHRFSDELDEFVALGKPVLGICNGFQTLVKAGYLPGVKGAGDRRTQQVTLTFNRRGQFECRWVRLRAVPDSRCLFTRNMDQDILCPVAHGEGRLAVPDKATRDMLWQTGLVALQYVAPEDGVARDDASATTPVRERAGYPANPNGSVDDIAGICNTAGNVFGLMPHPEDHIYPQQHPRWNRGESGGMGLGLFRNGLVAAADF
ncbi:MAG: phosphoribosylformylglycinamidine synthase I [Anaerolineae bacterium]|nr:phosphoribosylformylglycinamidine synthase I [Anaerolineae bacterium]